MGVFLVVEGAVDQRFEETLDRGDRRPQFVGNVGDEVAPDVLEMPQPRDVVQDDEDADLASLRIVQERAVGADPAVLCAADLDFVLHGRLAGQGGLDELQQIGFANDLVDAPPLQLDRLLAQQGCAGLVQAENRSFVVDRQDSLLHAG